MILAFTPRQWETVLLCNDVSHWLDEGLESAMIYQSLVTSPTFVTIQEKKHWQCHAGNSSDVINLIDLYMLMYKKRIWFWFRKCQIISKKRSHQMKLFATRYCFHPKYLKMNTHTITTECNIWWCWVIITVIDISLWSHYWYWCFFILMISFDSTLYMFFWSYMVSTLTHYGQVTPYSELWFR